MTPSALLLDNPVEGLSVRGMRNAFDHSPIKSAASVALFGASLYWGLKTAKKSGPVGAAIKGFIALTLMKKAKNSLIAAQNGRRTIAAA